MSAERETLHAKTTIVLVEHRDGEKIMYRPVLINDNGADEVGNFLKSEREKIKDRLLQLKTIPSKRRGVDISKREVRDMRKSRDKLISAELLEEKLSILNGVRLQPIRLVSGRGGAQECELATYIDEQQERFWSFLKQHNQMGRMVEIAKEYEEGLEMMFLFFDARYRHKYASVQEVAKVETELEEVKRRAANVSTDYDYLLTPVFKLISDKYGPSS